MYNALIFDAERGPCYLVRSILLGKNIGVSIATTAEDAQRKIETGLFDMLFANISEGSETELAFLRLVGELQPGLPIVTIITEGRGVHELIEVPHDFSRPAQQPLQVCCELTRPLRVGAVVEAANRAIAKINTAIKASSEKQGGIVMSVTAGDVSLPCLATRTSPHGALVESIARDQSALRAFEEFFTTNQDNRIDAAVPDQAGGVIRFKARIVFTERTADRHLKQVGLKFGES